AERDLGDHHASCVLLRVGKRDVGRRHRDRGICTTRNQGRSGGAASLKLLPINESAERQRAETVEQQFGAVAPGVVHYTTVALFRDLWLRPGLAPRDRSLVTVSALVASGQVAQISYHLYRAMDNGL